MRFIRRPTLQLLQSALELCLYQQYTVLFLIFENFAIAALGFVWCSLLLWSQRRPFPCTAIKQRIPFVQFYFCRRVLTLDASEQCLFIRCGDCCWSFYLPSPLLLIRSVCVCPFILCPTPNPFANSVSNLLKLTIGSVNRRIY